MIAVWPFPRSLFPVYAYQCVRSPLAKLILTGHVCDWEKDRKQINRKKTTHLHIIRQCIVAVKCRTVGFYRKEFIESYTG